MSIGVSLRPRKMKHITLTVLSRDVDAVIEFLGRRALIQTSSNENLSSGGVRKDASGKHIREGLDKLARAAGWLGVELPAEPLESSRFPGESEEELAANIVQVISTLSARESEQREEKRKVEEALNEARAFASLKAPFSDLDKLSYLTLRVGRLDTRGQEELRRNLSGRAVIIPLGSGDDGVNDRVLMAASRKGRSALDSELKKLNFVPISIPQGYKGIPSEMIASLEDRLKGAENELEEINGRREALKEEYRKNLQSLAASYLMANIIEQLKASLIATKNVYILSGWVSDDMLKGMVEGLETITSGRIAVRAYNHEELAKVREGREKVPVSLKHGAFVRGFERMVFSYGAPLYGTIDPTPFVAFFFTFLFGIMFGDLGQGFVLFSLGILTGKRGPAPLARFRHFSVPLVAVGISSMIMGLLTGSFFSNEEILTGPTHFITGLITGHPVERILHILPLPEKGGSVARLFYFFGFALSIGVLLNSAGLIINTVNCFSLKKYEQAIIGKTGLAGMLLFWYALFIAIRFVITLINPGGASFALHWYDVAGLVIPLIVIILGPSFWRFFSGERPVITESLMVFVVERLVEVIEIVSSNISNTVSFLRVGAFALSHAVLSYIIFLFTDMVSGTVMGTLAGFLIVIIGNLIIIVLEGMVVAIQVVRLQYYEFFGKFFTEMGAEFAPFRFRKERS